LADDFMKYNTELNNRINHKSVLVTGGAGTIGSNYIKAIEAMFENNLLRVLKLLGLLLEFPQEYYFCVSTNKSTKKNKKYKMKYFSFRPAAWNLLSYNTVAIPD